MNLPPDRRDEITTRILAKDRQRRQEREHRVLDGMRAIRLALVELRRDFERRLAEEARRLVDLEDEWNQRDETTIRLPVLPPAAQAETVRIERPKG